MTRGLLLVLRVHRLPAAAGAVVVLCGAIGWASAQHLTWRTASGAGFPLAVDLPLALAAVSVLSVHSPTGDADALASRPTPLLRAVPPLLLTVLGTVGVAVATTPLTGPATAPAAVRNLLLLTGLGLCAVPLVGALRAWVLPVAAVLAATTVGAGHGGSAPAANVVLQSDGDGPAWVVAAVVLVAGIGLVGLTSRSARHAHP